jgi:hypothetical protein
VEASWIMGKKDHCKYCIYFVPFSDYYWCYRHDMRVWDDTPRCPNFKGYSDVKEDHNSPYLGLMEREKDRKREQRINLFLSGLLGVIGVIIGVILGYLLKTY